jgi:CcmD family protein
MDPREFQYVFFGMLAVWLAIAVYTLSLAMRERKLKAELERVRRMLEKG